ncbi:MAG: hypothetical protein KJO11_08370 [Gemmatimonadetes bacterium]|nr:hypothetical protein [Gemmatimonadota bacterium]MBT8404762.1 hypothetical protein [Gemmatimonadota bacterium]NNF38831.1 hypothetical protein [Gemmatimonadota bacterium]NNK62689.1 hypothetical protein [Gemmatimonadota bacterium]
MRTRALSASLLVLVLAACGGGPPPEPPAPPPLDPTGLWDVMVEAQGMSLTGVMEISGDADAGYTGSIDTDMGGAALSDIEVLGQEVVFVIPDAGAEVRLVFEGDEFTGGISGAMGDAFITGMRRDGS